MSLPVALELYDKSIHISALRPLLIDSAQVKEGIEANHDLAPSLAIDHEELKKKCVIPK